MRERLGHLPARFGFDALIVLAAIEGALEVALGSDAAEAPSVTPWFGAPATALVVLPLLARRRFPFAAPAAVWVVAATLSFVDGALVVFSTTIFIAGMAASFLLGSLRDDVHARVGLAVAIGGAAIVVENKPVHSPGEFLFIPLLFAIGWLGGYAVHERAEQAEAAEERATRPSASATRLHASPWPRSAPASRASCTTSSRTR